MPFESSRTRLVRLMSLRARKCSQTSRRNRGCVAPTKSISWDDADPARQHRDVGDEADVLHEPVALVVGVEAEHRELAVEAREAEQGLERGRLAGAVRADQPDDAAGLDVEIHVVECARRAERSC